LDSVRTLASVSSSLKSFVCVNAFVSIHMDVHMHILCILLVTLPDLMIKFECFKAFKQLLGDAGSLITKVFHETLRKMLCFQQV